MFMRLNKFLQGDYTISSAYHQIKLPLDIEISIPSDDPVRLLSAFVEGMDLSDLYATYDRIRKNQATPRQMLKILIYAAMNRIYSSRDIESSCKRDINFIYLLDGAPAPDHSTIARFISLHLSRCSKKIMSEVGNILHHCPVQNRALHSGTHRRYARPACSLFPSSLRIWHRRYPWYPLSLW